MYFDQTVLSGTDHQIYMVLSAEEQAAVLQDQAQFTERLDNEYAVKAAQKREKRTQRQTARLEMYQILDTFAWDELPEAAQRMYSELGWTRVWSFIYI